MLTAGTVPPIEPSDDHPLASRPPRRSPGGRGRRRTAPVVVSIPRYVSDERGRLAQLRPERPGRTGSTARRSTRRPCSRGRPTRTPRSGFGRRCRAGGGRSGSRAGRPSSARCARATISASVTALRPRSRRSPTASTPNAACPSRHAAGGTTAKSGDETIAGKSAPGSLELDLTSRPFARSPTAAGSVARPARWSRAPLTSSISAARGDGARGSMIRSQLPTTSSAVSGVPSENVRPGAEVEHDAAGHRRRRPSSRRAPAGGGARVVGRQGLVQLGRDRARSSSRPRPPGRRCAAPRRGSGPRPGPRRAKRDGAATRSTDVIAPGRRRGPNGAGMGQARGHVAHGRSMREGPASHRRGNDAVSRGPVAENAEPRPLVRLRNRVNLQLRDTLTRALVDRRAAWMAGGSGCTRAARPSTATPTSATCGPSCSPTSSGAPCCTTASTSCTSRTSPTSGICARTTPGARWIPMLVAAGVEGRSSLEIADAYEAAFHADSAAMNILPAHEYPRATEHIPEMLALAERLEDLGHAYLIAGGQPVLRGRDVSRVRRAVAATRWTRCARATDEGEVEPDKRDPADFALWKAAGREPRDALAEPLGRGLPRLAPRVLGDGASPPRPDVRHPHRRRGQRLPPSRGRDRPVGADRRWAAGARCGSTARTC